MTSGLAGTPALATGPNGERYLHGCRVLSCEYASTLGSAGDVILVDLSQYEIVDKDSATSVRSIHVKFLEAESCYKFVYRCNGQPGWQSALRPYQGTATQSPIVVLEARA